LLTLLTRLARSRGVIAIPPLDGRSTRGSSKRNFIGTGPSLVVVDEGMGKSLSTTTLGSDTYAFVFGQKGLMGGMASSRASDERTRRVDAGSGTSMGMKTRAWKAVRLGTSAPWLMSSPGALSGGQSGPHGDTRKAT
jgi:hypothetical protein